MSTHSSGIRPRAVPAASRQGPLRPSGRMLPEHARDHHRALVLQLLHREGRYSRADLARATGLTRVTISDVVAELIDDGYVVDVGQREESRPGRPATLLDLNRRAFQIVGVDLSGHSEFRGAVLDLDGLVLDRARVPLDSATGEEATTLVQSLIEELIAKATAPLLGIGVGSPGIVDLAGTILSAPNLGWDHEPLQALLERFGCPVIVGNDANMAVLAEHGFGTSTGDTMLVTVGHGVGAGLLLGGSLQLGARFSAGEIGHVVVGTDGGELCACGKRGCLETWLATPRLQARLSAAPDSEREDILRRAGERLGIALAPVVGALDLDEVVLSGPPDLVGPPLATATLDTIRARTMPDFHGGVGLRMTGLGADIVLRGTAVMVLSAVLGVS